MLRRNRGGASVRHCRTLGLRRSGFLLRRGGALLYGLRGALHRLLSLLWGSGALLHGLCGALYRLLSLLRSGRTLLGSCRLRLRRGSLLRRRRAGLCRRFRLRGLGLWLGGRFCLGLIRVGTEFAEDIVKVEAVIFIAHFSPSSQFTVPPVRALSMAEFGMICQLPSVYSSSTSKAVVV